VALYGSRDGGGKRCAGLEPLEARLLLARLAVIGDFSSDVQVAPAQDVANLVRSFGADAVLTLGDNNYPDGAAATIDSNIGQWYHQFMYPYAGAYGAGSPDAQNHFWPALGNHDWITPGATPYLNYFTLPNNERYYTVRIGDIAVFVVDSDDAEPDGNTADSAQAAWVRAQMLASDAPWKLVTFHHSPFSSGEHGSSEWMQWPFKDWGATAVLSGHDHDYERLNIDGLPYFVNGAGGESLYPVGAAVLGSAFHDDADYGAMVIDSTATTLTFKFINRAGGVMDSYTVDAANPLVARTLIAKNATWSYLDDGSDQGSAWRNAGFDDSGWKSGPAELGYGDGDEATVVSYGANANKKYITTYFRKTISVPDPQAAASLSLNLLRDDGAVVYLNGTEIYRSNMPDGEIAYDTEAASAIEDSTYHHFAVDPALLRPGSNVIAVEVHQESESSSDISFNFDLTATWTPPPDVPTAPSPSGVVINSTPVTLDWADVPNVSAYDVLLGAEGTYVGTVGASEYTGWIPPADGEQLWRIVAHNSGGSTAGPQWSFTLDTTPPTATYGQQTPNAGDAALDFTIAYADATTAVDAASFDDGDITVTGPNGFVANAIFLSAAGTIATYRINAPGGTWNTADAGGYTVTQNAGQVQDTAHNARPAGAIATFTASPSFAWESGTTLNVEFDDSGTPITLVSDDGSSPISSGGNSGFGHVTADRARTALTFSDVDAIVVFGSDMDDQLQIEGTLAIPLTFQNGAGNDTVRLLTGSYTFNSALAPTTHNAAVTIDPGATGIFAAAQQLPSLVIHGAAQLAPGGRVLEVGALDISGSGARLDLSDGALIVHSTAANRAADLAAVTAKIKSGLNLGGTLWTGDGITTSLGGNGSGDLHALGVVVNDLAAAGAGSGALYSTFAGENVGVNDILVRYTLFGDADLDGAVTTNDYFQIDNGFLGAKAGWINGDFDYDGAVTTNDYFVIDNAFLGQGASPAPAASAATGAGNVIALPAKPTARENDDALQMLAAELFD
jgi:hypothetical protein